MAVDRISLIKQLRKSTGLGMMECKNALAESNYDIDAAVEQLRKRSAVKAAKKSQRETSEGIVCMRKSSDSKSAVVIKLLSETDFMAKNDKFLTLAENIMSVALNNYGKNAEELYAIQSESGETIKELIDSTIAVAGENINLANIEYMSVKEGIIAGYTHGSSTDDKRFGKSVAMLSLVPEKQQDENSSLEEIGKKVGMQLVASPPLALNSDFMNKAVVEKERALQIDIAKQSGKPDNIIEKIVEGKMRAFLSQSTLAQAPCIFDQKSTVSDFVNNEGKAVNLGNIDIKGYVVFTLSEDTKSGNNNE